MDKKEHKMSDNKKLAFRATLHCVIGCGSGDTLGLIIGTVLNWAILPTMILGIILGFIGGYGLTLIPLLKRGFKIKEASKITVLSETASIIVMEAAENGTAFFISGLSAASLLTWLYWFGLIVAVVAGFIAAYPINYYMISKGLKESHIHH